MELPLIRPYPHKKRNPPPASRGSFSSFFVGWFLSLPFHDGPTPNDFSNYDFDTRSQRAGSVRTVATRLRQQVSSKRRAWREGTRRSRRGGLSGVSFSTGFPYYSNGYPYGPNAITCLSISYTIRCVMDELDPPTFGGGFWPTEGRASFFARVRFRARKRHPRGWKHPSRGRREPFSDTFIPKSQN